MGELLLLTAAGFTAQLVDGALGMTYGVPAATVLLSVGGACGAYLLATVPGEKILPFASLHLLAMGLVILWQAIRPRIAHLRELRSLRLQSALDLYEILGAPAGWLVAAVIWGPCAAAGRADLAIRPGSALELATPAAAAAGRAGGSLRCLPCFEVLNRTAPSRSSRSRRSPC